MFNILVFILGLSVGSFLNVVIYRLEKGELILISRSRCPSCKTVLKWHDLIPLMSFVLLLGKCRHCQKRISWQYPIVEISTALLFVFIVLNRPLVIPNLIGNLDYISTYWIPAFAGMTFNLILVSFLIVIFVYDLKHYIIPDKIVYPAIIIAFLFQIFQKPVFNLLLAGLLAAGFFLLLVLVSKGKWMGWGDVKLAFLMGLILGWPGIFIALFLSFFSGALVGIALIISGKKKMKSEIPFGPFLAGSTILVILFGSIFNNIVQSLFFF